MDFHEFYALLHMFMTKYIFVFHMDMNLFISATQINMNSQKLAVSRRDLF